LASTFSEHYSFLQYITPEFKTDYQISFAEFLESLMTLTRSVSVTAECHPQFSAGPVPNSFNP
jgi:hypothetical protein